MRALSTHELLAVWECGQQLSADERALALLSTADPEMSASELASLGIGERDRRLMLLREWAFGPEVGGRADCPHCGGRLEFDFRLDDVRTPPGKEEGAESSILVDGHEVILRSPVVRDLDALAGLVQAEAARQRLLERCILRVTREGQELRLADLPEAVVTAVVDEMTRLDAQAVVELVLSCPVCAHQWTTMFDIVSFFWTEIHAWAVRVLYEVHQLARAYGWREGDILSLSPWRREAYLEILGQ